MTDSRKYENLHRTLKRLLNRADVLGGRYADEFLRGVDEAIEREYAAAETKRKADNEADLRKKRVAA
jgi:hypothetical protein